jgi:glycine/D-amino acid oxidase-like deaminating enzyme
VTSVDPTDPLSPRGWWLRQALDREAGEAHATDQPAVAGDERADVVVVGGGYTGMWTAYFLTERRPDAGVVLLEQQICGGGPSGRNGGFATGWWDELPDLAALYGGEPAVRMCRALGRSIDELGAWCERHRVDAWYTKRGYLDVASAPAQEGDWEEAVALVGELGVADELRELSRAEVQAVCRSPVFGGGVFMRDGATVQPALLARGLRRVLLERGVRIHERTPALRFRTTGGGVEVETPGGTVRANALVMAPGSWGAGWSGPGRSLALWGSYIVLTEPAPERLRDVGWTGGECITDIRSALHYFRTTEDGRIAFGGGGGRAIRRMSPAAWYDPPSIERAERGFRRLFPSFEDVRLEEGWGGPIDVSPMHTPFYGTLEGGPVHFGFGYTGNGVAPSHLGGKILSGLALEEEDEVTGLPMVRSRPPRFPPEPLKSLGARVVREAVVRKERAEDEGRRVPRLTREAARLPRRFGFRLGPE